MRLLLWMIFLVTPVFLGSGTAVLAAAPDAGIELKKLLPLSIGDYRSDGKDELFNRETTFRYMDGAAELYRSYAFGLLLVRRYVKKDHPPIVVELFDMGSPGDAFGVFSFETEEQEADIGQGSEYGGGLLRFWKSKFFVNVYSEQETTSTRQDLLEAGRAVSASIKGEGPKPRLLDVLPREDLVSRSIRYFHLHQSLNHHYFISHENLLKLGERTEALLATYQFPQGGKTRLLLVRYPDPKAAGEALKRFVRAYMPEAPSPKVVRTEDGRWTGAEVLKAFVTVVFDAPDPERVRSMIETVRRNLGERRP